MAADTQNESVWRQSFWSTPHLVGTSYIVALISVAYVICDYVLEWTGDMHLINIFLMLLMALIGPFIAFQFLFKRHWRCLLPLLAMALATYSLIAIGNMWGFRKKLPYKSQVVGEAFWDQEVFLPDYSYNLKVRISHEDYMVYCKKFGLSNSGDGSLSPSSSSFQNSPSDWWDPPKSGPIMGQSDGKTQSYTRATYKDGFMWLESSDS